MEKFNILHVLATVVAIMIAFVVGWCQGESSAREDYQSQPMSESARCKIERAKVMLAMIEERIAKASSDAYQHGWEDSLAFRRFVMDGEQTNNVQQIYHWRDIFTNKTHHAP